MKKYIPTLALCGLLALDATTYAVFNGRVGQEVANFFAPELEYPEYMHARGSREYREKLALENKQASEEQRRIDEEQLAQWERDNAAFDARLKAQSLRFLATEARINDLKLEAFKARLSRIREGRE